MDAYKKYTFALSRTGKVGPVTFEKLMKVFDSPEEAYKSSPKKLREIGLNSSAVEAIKRARKDNLDEELSLLESKSVKLVGLKDDDYPPLLKEIKDPPYLLYVVGDIHPNDQRSVAVVGSRKISSYGKQVTDKLVSELTLNDFTVVSGLALGTDSRAHKAALESEGRTIGVLGSGILKVSPRSSQGLARRIVKREKGAVISEFPPYMDPLPYNFPVRNRIISGMSLGVLVIQASIKSGTLHTASHASDQGREVFAVPGDIFRPTSKGAHELLRKGAKLVEEVEDIVDELDISVDVQKEKYSLEPENEEEKEILEIIGNETVHIDDIIRRSDLESSKVTSLLTGMELKGMILDTGAGNFRKSF